MPSKLLLATAAQVFYGAAKYARAIGLYGRQGVPVTPELRFHSFGAIAAASSTAVAASQSVGAGAAFAINGGLASGGVATFATPRNVVAAWTTASVLTITGTDEYGSIMVEVTASAQTHTGKKAFKTITSITSSASITGATVGSGTVIGLPLRVDENGLIIAKQAGATDAATFVEADTTTATGTTGDVRGTVSFAQAPNGSILFAVLIKCADPSTKVGAYGVKQFGSTDAA